MLESRKDIDEDLGQQIIGVLKDMEAGRVELTDAGRADPVLGALQEPAELFELFPILKQFMHRRVRGGWSWRELPREKQRQLWEQGCRSRWRAILLILLAKFEAIEAGISTFEREFLAANGYVVVAVNYRGSNGRGSANASARPCWQPCWLCSRFRCRS